MSDESKMAEERAYQKGYRAGKLKGQTEKRRAGNWNQAFLAALPACIGAKGWVNTVGEKKIPITDLPAKTKLAADFADEAVKYMR